MGGSEGTWPDGREERGEGERGVGRASVGRGTGCRKGAQQPSAGGQKGGSAAISWGAERGLRWRSAISWGPAVPCRAALVSGTAPLEECRRGTRAMRWLGTHEWTAKHKACRTGRSAPSCVHGGMFQGTLKRLCMVVVWRANGRWKRRGWRRAIEGHRTRAGQPVGDATNHQPLTAQQFEGALQMLTAQQQSITKNSAALIKYL